MMKIYANENWLMTVKKENEKLKFVFSELPRTPEVGNDDFTIVLTKIFMRFHEGTGDGYGVFRKMLHQMEDLDMIAPVLGGWVVYNPEEVAALIFYFFENDEKVNVFLRIYWVLKNELQDSWDSMPKEERFNIVEDIVTRKGP